LFDLFIITRHATTHATRNTQHDTHTTHTTHTRHTRSALPEAGKWEETHVQRQRKRAQAENLIDYSFTMTLLARAKLQHLQALKRKYKHEVPRVSCVSCAMVCACAVCAVTRVRCAQ
jgi:hypothetical protein